MEQSLRFIILTRFMARRICRWQEIEGDPTGALNRGLGVPLGPPRSVRERERDLRRVLLVLFESSERGDGRTGDRRTGVGNSGRAEFWRRIAVNVSSPGTLPPGTLLLCVWLLLFPLMLSTMRRRGADAGR